MSSITQPSQSLPQRTKTFDFLQNLRANAISQVIPGLPSPTQNTTSNTNNTETSSIIPRSTRFSGTIEDLRKSITAFSIRSSDSESDHDYYPSRGGSRSRWSSVSGSLSLSGGPTPSVGSASVSGARTPSVLSHEEAAALRTRNKAAVTAAARRKYDARCRKWALERQLRDRYICECEKARTERRHELARTNPEFQAAVEQASSTLLVQEMFLKSLAAKANKLVEGAGMPCRNGVEAEAPPSPEDLQKAMKETSEAVMSLIR
ncbi:hypothetical protein HOO65_040281 [Ceratocystis lukuohia]|uniref:Uncharacterized protein n=3 Tax=Ceratocystis TaxID=5157 RepID=A0A0F8B4V1_CERFI|nr:hypothetical protein CFO_g626 [Ceratocystis platani]PHH51650.1 hypothetical protein CFIMG_004479RA [Ceratocystis fimbriata CBS 114723]